MSLTKKGQRVKYPSSTSRLLGSVFIAIASPVLAVLLLSPSPFYLLVYFGLSAAILVLFFFLRIFSARELYSEVKDETLAPDERKTFGWRAPLSMSFVLAMLLVLPLFLAGFLEPHLWFAGVVAVATGGGIGEIVFYIYTKGWRH